MPSPGAVPMDAETAAAYGLTLRGDARAQGLFDRFHRGHTYLRISVTERCNLRCRYCMPEEGVQLLPKDHLLSFEEIERLAALFVRLGVRKIRLTGGEPLVRRGIDELIARIGALKANGLERLMMTSNALLLREHIPALLRAGMDAVNLSLDTLRADRFRRITGREGCEETIAAIPAARGGGLRKERVSGGVRRGITADGWAARPRPSARARPMEGGYIKYLPWGGTGGGGGLKMSPGASPRPRLEEQLRLEP